MDKDAEMLKAAKLIISTYDILRKVSGLSDEDEAIYNKYKKCLDDNAGNLSSDKEKKMDICFDIKDDKITIHNNTNEYIFFNRKDCNVWMHFKTNDEAKKWIINNILQAGFSKSEMDLRADFDVCCGVAANNSITIERYGEMLKEQLNKYINLGSDRACDLLKEIYE
jgi:hypothetical protein